MLARSAFQTRKPPRAGRPAWKCADSVQVARLNAQIADLRGRIDTRAEKLAFSSNGLALILSTEFTEYRRIRRRPSATQMTKALRGEQAFRAARVVEAREQLAEAQRMLASREAAAEAGRAACLLYTGFEA